MTKSSEVEFSKASFVRACICRMPDLDLNELKAEWRKNKGTPRTLPVQQDIYNATSILRNRYGIKVKEFPRKGDGEVNVSELIRILSKKNPKWSAVNINDHLSQDGFKVHNSLVEKVLGGASDHPDPNHDNGPRAGKPEKTTKFDKGTDRRSKKGRVSVIELQAVKSLVKELGGVDQARQAIEAVERAGDVGNAKMALDAYEDLIG